jgi:DNA excision repair protein ERCC-2
MRPTRGAMLCIRCTTQGKARTVLAGGRRIALAAGQQGLGGVPAAAAGGVEPPLQPQASTYRPSFGGQLHPQLGLFPYDEIRDGQRRLTRDVTLAVQAGKHLVAQAPTGIGKTAASLAPALQFAIASGKTVLFLTSRQSQHRIAVETLRTVRDRRGASFGVVDLVSKRDMCLRAEAQDLHPGRFGDFCATETRTKSCKFLGEVDGDTLRRVREGVLHVTELMHVARQAQLCPHLVALTAAKEAKVVVADYNHLFSDIREQSLERLGLTLADCILIVDEAHNLPDRIRASHSHRVTPFLLDQVGSEARAHKARDVEADLGALRNALGVLAQQALRSNSDQEAKLGGGTARVAKLPIEALPIAFEAERNRILGLHRTLEDAVKGLQQLAAQVRKGTDSVVHAEELAEALEDWGRFASGALRYLEWEDAGSPTLNVRLLDAAIPAKTVFQRVHSAILMSGTLRPPEMARDLLGLDSARTTVRTYPSPFPPEHRLVAIAQGFTTRFASRGPELWTRMATILQETASATRGNLAVFAPSYAILRDLRDALEASGVVKELILEDPAWGKRERDEVLDQLESWRGKGGAILLGVLGGSFSEGVDFRDNLLSVVAVAGLPLAPPDLEVEAAIGYLEARFPGMGRAYGYTYPAMNKVLQAMGRAIRGPVDKCAILLLDERYAGPPYRSLLPDAPTVVSADPAAAVRPFLTTHAL